jgi:hypothetical protein
MKVTVTSNLDCPPDLVWDEVQTSSLLLKIIDPLLKIIMPPGTEMPPRFEEGLTIKGWVYVFCVLPMGLHSIYFEVIDPHRRYIQTREKSRWLRCWDHVLRVEATPDGRARYSDEVEIDAGILTPLVWLFARCFYRHRHRRWQRIARCLASKR